MNKLSLILSLLALAGCSSYQAPRISNSYGGAGVSVIGMEGDGAVSDLASSECRSMGADHAKYSGTDGCPNGRCTTQWDCVPRGM